jgi:HSP20 family protein
LIGINDLTTLWFMKVPAALSIAAGTVNQMEVVMAFPSLLPSLWRDPQGNELGFDQLQKEVDRVFRNFARGFPVPTLTSEEGFPFGRFVPKIDINESDGKMEISVELPGVPEDAIEVSLTDNVLTIKGEKKSETEDKDKDYHVVERSYGMFQRVIQLPFDPGKAEPEATFRDGVLRITIPKPTEAAEKKRKIEIRSAG